MLACAFAVQVVGVVPLACAVIVEVVVVVVVVVVVSVVKLLLGCCCRFCFVHPFCPWFYVVRLVAWAGRLPFRLRTATAVDLVAHRPPGMASRSST